MQAWYYKIQTVKKLYFMRRCCYIPLNVVEFVEQAKMSML